MDKDIIVCLIGILICHLLVLALAELDCKPGSQRQEAVREQNRLKSFSVDQIVPDAIDVAPSSVLSVSDALAVVLWHFFWISLICNAVSPPPPASQVAYRPGVAANLGNTLHPKDVSFTPTVTWEANLEHYYTLVLIGKIHDTGSWRPQSTKLVGLLYKSINQTNKQTPTIIVSINQWINYSRVVANNLMQLLVLSWWIVDFGSRFFP